MEIWPILEEELERYSASVSSIRHCLAALEEKCSSLILCIGKSSFADCNSSFDELFRIQQKIAILAYKHKFPLGERMQEFLYHFERDDFYARKYWYEKFKSGQLWPRE